MMKKRWVQSSVVVAMSSLFVIFQNCDGGFAINEKSGQLFMLSEGDLKVGVTDEATGSALSEVAEIAVDKAYVLTIDRTGIEIVGQPQWTQESTVANACHLHNGADAFQKILHCEAASEVVVTVRAVLSDNREVYGAIRRVAKVPSAAGPTPTPPPTGTPPANPSIPVMVQFRIPAGTGSNSWNTLPNAVKVYVGQTLRIINDDSIPHRLHTGGNRPCAHQPADTPPGGFFDCVIGLSVSAAAGTTYDHNIGVNAKFYVEAIDGNTLYANRCASCHQPLATSRVRRSTAAQITGAIATIPAMRTIQLNADEIAAISFSLR